MEFGLPNTLDDKAGGSLPEQVSADLGPPLLCLESNHSANPTPALQKLARAQQRVSRVSQATEAS